MGEPDQRGGLLVWIEDWLAHLVFFLGLVFVALAVWGLYIVLLTTLHRSAAQPDLLVAALLSVLVIPGAAASLWVMRIVAVAFGVAQSRAELMTFGQAVSGIWRLTILSGWELAELWRLFWGRTSNGPAPDDGTRRLFSRQTIRLLSRLVVGATLLPPIAVLLAPLLPILLPLCVVLTLGAVYGIVLPTVVLFDPDFRTTNTMCWRPWRRGVARYSIDLWPRAETGRR